MKIVIQKVSDAKVVVNNEVQGAIGVGYLLLVGVEAGDSEVDAKRAADKIASMRLFEDAEGKINLNLDAVEGRILSISQFTLAADIRKGNRPSFSGAMEQDEALRLYEYFNECLRNHAIEVETGVFQADMSVTLTNEGPLTIIMNVKDGKVL